MAFEVITNHYFSIVIASIGILFGIISTISYLQQRRSIEEFTKCNSVSP
jgi:hypothetical protein